jgi:hypothetical protein
LKYVSIFRKGDLSDESYNSNNDLRFMMVLLGSAFGQHIQTDFDHQANFSRYKTYSWQEVREAVITEAGMDPSVIGLVYILRRDPCQRAGLTHGAPETRYRRTGFRGLT